MKLGRNTLGKPIMSRMLPCLIEVMCQPASGTFQADFFHALLEQVPVFGLADGLGTCTDQDATVAVEDTCFVQRSSRRLDLFVHLESVGVHLVFQPPEFAPQPPTVIGSIYVRSAISGSVMIVAGLELTSTTL